MKYLYQTIFFLLLIQPLRTTPNVIHFEGSINLVRETIFDTTKISIYVLGDQIRFEEIDSKGKKIGSFLIDMQKETVLAFNHPTKTYTYLPAGIDIATNDSKLEYIRTENFMEINGEKCYQWRVKDRQRNTEVTYWVALNKIDCFPKLMKLLSRTDLSFNMFGAIPISKGFMPMLTVERTLLRKEKLKMQVVEIIETHVSRNLFNIPSGYRQTYRQA